MSQGAHIVGLGARSDCIATVPQVDADRLGLTPDEVLVLVQVGRLATLAEVLERSTFSEPQTIALLLSLRAKGAIAPLQAQRPTPPPVASAAPPEAVELDPERKQELLGLEERLERGESLFALLGVPPGAGPAEVKRAFYELSKRLHPDRFYGKALGSFRARVERVFRGLTEAHTTLTDPERREAYLAAHPELARASRSTPPPAGSVTPLPREGVDGERDAERRARLARHPYLLRTARGRELQARVRQLLEQGDTETALAEVSRLVQVDPKAPEALALQAEVRRRHEEARARRELARGLEAAAQGDLGTAASALRLAASLDPTSAEAAYRAAEVLRRQGADVVEVRTLAQRAVELAPRKADYRFLLGLVLLDGGAKKSARAHFEAVLELDPEHEGARAQVKKLRWVF